jgi:hypothetical protein
VIAAVSTFGAGALLPGALGGCSGAAGRVGVGTAPRPDLIRQENAKPGSPDWLLTKTAVDPATKWRSPWIEGWFSQASAAAGETVALHVSTAPASRFRAELYRLGFYGGAGARKVADLGEFDGAPQPEPAEGPRRLKACRWTATATLAVDPGWTSGVYLARLTELAGGRQSYATFVVRDARRADLIVQVSDTTWQAYNRWPSQYSLYDDGKSQWYWGAGVDVSFDRPYGKYCQILDQPLSLGSGEFLLWEFPLAYWLEREGYDVTYASNVDLHADPGGVMRAKGFLSVGHDEYYSLPMFHGLRRAIASGLNVAFLSGNTCCGLIEFEDAPDGRRHRVMRRLDRFGPPDETGNRLFDRMKTLPRTGPNEADLIGARSTGVVMGGAPWTCAKPDHWLFRGTGMKAGEGIPGLVGWEWHGDPAPIPGLEIVAEGATQCSAGPGRYTATVYPGPLGNLVFNASTCWWGDGLSAPPGYKHPSAHGAAPKGPDPRVRRITANLLARMIG